MLAKGFRHASRLDEMNPTTLDSLRKSRNKIAKYAQWALDCGQTAELTFAIDAMEVDGAKITASLAKSLDVEVSASIFVNRITRGQITVATRVAVTHAAAARLCADCWRNRKGVDFQKYGLPNLQPRLPRDARLINWDKSLCFEHDQADEICAHLANLIDGIRHQLIPLLSPLSLSDQLLASIRTDYRKFYYTPIGLAGAFFVYMRETEKFEEWAADYLSVGDRLRDEDELAYVACLRSKMAS